MRLSEIIERLEKAEDFDREADREIGRLLLGWTVTKAYIETDERDVYPNHPGALYPTFTESLETAIALAEKVLPGWRGSIQFGNYSGPVRAYLCPHVETTESYADHVSPAIALCIAVLKAKKDLGNGE